MTMTIWEVLRAGYVVVATEVDDGQVRTRTMRIEWPRVENKGRRRRSGLAQLWFEKADWIILSGLFAVASILAMVVLWL